MALWLYRIAPTKQSPIDSSLAVLRGLVLQLDGYPNGMFHFHTMYHSIMSPFCLFHMCYLYCISRCSRVGHTLRPVMAIPVLAAAAFVLVACGAAAFALGPSPDLVHGQLHSLSPVMQNTNNMSPIYTFHLRELRRNEHPVLFRL